MDMTFVYLYLQKLHLVAFLNFQRYLFLKSNEPCLQTLLVDILPEIPSGTSTPLRWDSYGYIAHPQCLRRKRRGIRPQGSILSVSEVIKTRIFTTERQLNLAYRAVTLLADDNFRLTLVR